MKPIQILVNFPLAAAVGSCRSQYGTTTVAVTDADLAAMPEAVRARVGGAQPVNYREHPDALEVRVSLSNGERLELAGVAAPTVPALVDAIAELNARVDARHAELNAHHAAAQAINEAAVLACEAAPVAAWLSSAGTLVSWPDGVDYRLGNIRAEHSARVEAAREAADRSDEARAVRAGIVERREAAERAAEASRAAHQARRDACSSALRTLAAQEPDLARAAEDGYPVERQIVLRLGERLAEAVGHAEVRVGRGLRRIGDDRAAPKPATFALRDKIVAAVDAANLVLPEAIGRWTVSRIVREDVCPHTDEEHNVTAILAQLDTPTDGTDVEVLWSPESLACTHAHGDDEAAS